ncbi:YkgJ family cysteine cluster protein [Desulfovibrio inopinatus]|uniref:YkgJ family cysteine cluster protein n=1 Tax=Desulfovibrio inopinatus TaxID=102109 RepID=UPI003CCBE2DB
MWRHCWYFFRGKTPVIRGGCLQCGGCCRYITLMYEGKMIRSRWQFDRICKKDPVFRRFVVAENAFMKNLVFRCNLLSEEGTCLDYENRPQLCKDYPTRHMVYYGGAPSAHCGFYIAETTSFARILKKTIRANRKKERKGS